MCVYLKPLIYSTFTFEIQNASKFIVKVFILLFIADSFNGCFDLAKKIESFPQLYLFIQHRQGLFECLKVHSGSNFIKCWSNPLQN